MVASMAIMKFAAITAARTSGRWVVRAVMGSYIGKKCDEGQSAERGSRRIVASGADASERCDRSSVPMLSREMLIEERRDLLERLFCFRRGVVEEILRVRLALKNMRGRFNAGLTELPMDAHGVAQQEIARSACKDRWGKSAQVSINRGE